MKWNPFSRKKNAWQPRTVRDVDDDDFQVQVIDRSYKTPVMVDFWAAWCAPCRRLGPMLERMADRADGAFVLAKLNTEFNQRTAARYGIQSIPAVKIFRNGQIIDQFTGVAPEAYIQQVVRRSIENEPPPAKIKGSGRPKKRLRQARHHLQKGKGMPAWLLLLDFPEGPEAEEAQALRPLARFLVDMRDGDGLTGFEAVDRLLDDAATALSKRRYDAALDHLRAVQAHPDVPNPEKTAAVVAGLVTLLGEEHASAKTANNQQSVIND